MTKVVNIRFDSYDVYIGRGGKWGNPFIVGKDGDRATVIAKHRTLILNRPDLLQSLHEIRGKVLGCYCKPLPCHGDVLVDLCDASCVLFDPIVRGWGSAVVSVYRVALNLGIPVAVLDDATKQSFESSLRAIGFDCAAVGIIIIDEGEKNVFKY